MKVCILGNNLTSLTLAQNFSQTIGINVDIFIKKKTKINKTRTLGISKDNIEIFNNENILNIKKLLWKINKIEIYNDNLKNEKLINFDNKNKSIIFNCQEF